ncbi:MAG: hypothetical protein HOP22_16645 [Nitrospiraceae bacterium]|nr:hypothetical protein [Nitrospiraceae bacterium]
MWHVVLAMLMTLVCVGLSMAQTKDQQRESLRGLQGVEVVVEDLNPDTQVEGLSQETIRAAVELILRSKGIRILSQSERSAIHPNPSLYVAVGPEEISSGQYSFNARVELHRAGSLPQRPQQVSAPTWFTPGKLRTVGQQNARLWVINSIEPLVREFANDFLAVNPR